MELITRQALIESIDRFPQTTGVYIMKDERDGLLYIGKANNVRSRVRSYFSDTHEDRPYIAVMMKLLHHIEWIATDNETEALILEANLVRKHKPRFNIDLKDDKHYPYLKVSMQERFPRLTIVRRVDGDKARKARYFGPYTDGRAMRSLVKHARTIFKIRDCKRSLPLKQPARPCINFSIGQCCGACAGKISEADYDRNIDLLLRFLKGRRGECLRQLQDEMHRASADLRFEDAARLRDRIRLIEEASKLQKVDLTTPEADCDAVGVFRGDRSLCLVILQFREGLLMSARHFLIGSQAWDIAEPGRESILLQFYMDERNEAPPEICIPDNLGLSAPLLEQWFAKQCGKTVKVIVPQKGDKRQLVEMANKNARLYLMQKLPSHPSEDCADLQALMHLPAFPKVIEAFDISNIGGSFAVAGMARFVDGYPDKTGYRRYTIKSVIGQNDFAMMMEAVSRRLSRLKKEGRPFADCLLIDGGLGQLNAACAVARRFSEELPVISIAKKEELLYSPFINEAVRLPAGNPALKLVQRIRDEAHRFAVTFHRSLRGRQFKTTLLRAIPGIGPKKTIRLLRAFGSLSGILEATAEDIAKVEGFSLTSATKLLQQARQARQARETHGEEKP